MARMNLCRSGGVADHLDGPQPSASPIPPTLPNRSLAAGVTSSFGTTVAPSPRPWQPGSTSGRSAATSPSPHLSHQSGNRYFWDGVAGKMALLNPAPRPSVATGGTQTREEGGTRSRREMEARRAEQYAGFSRGDDETARVLRECDRGCTVGGEPPSLRTPTGSDRSARGRTAIALGAK
jgi:hypothetical protein